MSHEDSTDLPLFEQRPISTGFNASPDEDMAGPSLSAQISAELAAEMDEHFGYGRMISDEEADEIARLHDEIEMSLLEFARRDELLISTLAAQQLVADAMLADAENGMKDRGVA